MTGSSNSSWLYSYSVHLLPDYPAEQKPTGKSPSKQEETLSGTRTIWEGGASFVFWDLRLDGGGGGQRMSPQGRSLSFTQPRSRRNQTALRNPLDGFCHQSEADEDLFSFTLQSAKAEHSRHSEGRFRRKSDIGAPLRAECCFKWRRGSFQLS